MVRRRHLGNRRAQWSPLGVFARTMTELAVQAQQTNVAVIDETHVKAHRTASSLAPQTERGLRIGRTKGPRTRSCSRCRHLLAAGSACSCPLARPRTKSVREGLSSIPQTDLVLADRGCDAG